MTGMKPYALSAGAALAILLAGCNSSSTTGGAARSAAATTAAASAGSQASGGIVISGFTYSGTLTVKPGQKVTVTNQDSVMHTLTDKKSHLFDTGDIAAGGGKGTFIAPTKPGSYPFGCAIHPDMQGTLIVKG
jgi:plastocyanin